MHNIQQVLSNLLFQRKRSFERETLSCWMKRIPTLDEKDPHIRNIRDGKIIKLDANNGAYTVDMWICLDETGPVFSWEGQ